MLKTQWAVVFVATSLAFAGLGCDSKPSEGAKAGETKAAEKTDTKSAAKDEKAAPAGNKVASCNLIKTESLCRQYAEANISAAGEDFLKNLCTGGDFKMEACPADKRVGSCVTQEGTKVYYTEGPLPLTADAAAKSCKEGVPAGEWKAGS